MQLHSGCQKYDRDNMNDEFDDEETKGSDESDDNDMTMPPNEDDANDNSTE